MDMDIETLDGPIERVLQHVPWAVRGGVRV
jgi:hypothetical protein